MNLSALIPPIQVKNVDKEFKNNPAWVPLFIKGIIANTDEEIRANIEAALKLDYIPFNELIGIKSGAVAIVGSGPSLKKNWHKLKRFNGDIIACNSACKFLLDKGIVPQYMVCFDADRLMLAFMQAHPDITYLLASRVPPEAFEMVKGCKIVCWHAAGDECLEELLAKHGREEPMVLGGCAAVTRTLYVAITMGYKTVHMYGVDSSYIGMDTHISKSRTEERRLPVRVNDKVFITAPWMSQQAEDFKILVPLMQKINNTEVIVHGTGLIPYIAQVMGLKTDESFLAKFIRILKWRTTILWQHV